MKKNETVQEVTNLSVIHREEPPSTPEPDNEEHARELWHKMVTLRNEINRLKEKYHVGGG